MSYCSTRNRQHSHTSPTQLQTTSIYLRNMLQCWISTCLAAGWMPTQRIYDRAQEGGLLHPIGLIEVNLPGFNFNFLS